MQGSWTAPQLGWIKFNMLWFLGHVGGIAYVAGHHTGQVLACAERNWQVDLMLRLLRLTLRLALGVAKQMGYEHVVLDGDCLMVIKGIKSGDESLEANKALFIKSKVCLLYL